MTDYTFLGEYGPVPDGSLILPKISVSILPPPPDEKPNVSTYINSLWCSPRQRGCLTAVVCGPIIQDEQMQRRKLMAALQDNWAASVAYCGRDGHTAWSEAYLVSNVFITGMCKTMRNLIVEQMDSMGVDDLRRTPMSDVFDLFIAAIVASYDIFFDTIVEYITSDERIRQLVPQHTRTWQHPLLLHTGMSNDITGECISATETRSSAYTAADLSLDGRECVLVCFNSVRVRDMTLLRYHDLCAKAYVTTLHNAVRSIIVPVRHKSRVNVDTWIYQFINAANT